MSLGSATPSPSASTWYVCQVPGMNCIGPTAWSYTGSPSYRPPSVSRTRCSAPCPLRAGPMIGGRTLPSGWSTAPPARPWSDSTLPIAASVVHARWQPGLSAASRRVAYPYARNAAGGIDTPVEIRWAQPASASWGRPVAEGVGLVDGRASSVGALVVAGRSTAGPLGDCVPLGLAASRGTGDTAPGREIPAPPA